MATASLPSQYRISLKVSFFTREWRREKYCIIIVFRLHPTFAVGREIIFQLHLTIVYESGIYICYVTTSMDHKHQSRLDYLHTLPRLDHGVCWICRLYILLTYVFWNLFGKILIIQWSTSRTSTHGIVFYFMVSCSSSEFFTRTKETRWTVVLFLTFQC